ncbi:MAG: hypothetical protein JXE06_02475 [Coriobacteriia bacterium]|nr:hypothetical protein [Coriobacteriia bacterium]MBN2822372.1 hypothetical protein [Coriobacteriia bacterium]
MSATRRIKGEMRERLDDMSEAAAMLERDPGPVGDPWGCWIWMIGIFVAALVILGTLYATGVIDYDFTQTPEEREAVDLQEPGPPYMEGRHYAIIGIGTDESRRVYTFELLGEGDSGTIRVWEDETGKGTYSIADGTITIEMERMVPPDKHEIWEPNTFTGSIDEDEGEFRGDWSRADWMGVPGEMALTGEWETIGFEAQRL